MHRQNPAAWQPRQRLRGHPSTKRSAQHAFPALDVPAILRQTNGMEYEMTLEVRDSLPDALQVLLHDYPRAGWPLDANFDGLVRFWLDRHLAFRRLMGLMLAETAQFLDRNADPRVFASRLSRLGGQFVGDLQGHHQIEDAHYFPALSALESRIAAGFDLLDSDHHALDLHLEGFITSANGVLTRLDDRHAMQTAAGSFARDLAGLERLLNRHLIDEEDLVVPVILRHGAGALG